MLHDALISIFDSSSSSSSAMQTWTYSTPLGKGPSWREYYTATVFDQQIYIMGGHERDKVSSELYRLMWGIEFSIQSLF